MRAVRVGLVVVLASVVAVAASAADGASASSVASCKASTLKVYLGGGSGGAAGSVYVGLNFVNEGSASCTLGGYPGVSFVDAAHHQVGAAATRSATTPARTVTLRPGARASVTLRITETGNYPTSTCRPKAARGLRVYPPGQTRPAFVVKRQSVCSATAVKQLSVTAVALGAPAG